MAQNNSFKLFKNKNMRLLRERYAPPVLVAEALQSPENIGAVLRLAANIGALKVWFVYDEPPGFRQYKINRRSSGAAEKTDWDYIRREELFRQLPRGYEYIAIETTPDATNIYLEKLPEKVVLFVGNERYGLSDKMLSHIEKRVFIPLAGPISSLNVSQALAVAMFEWFRQQIYA